MVDYESSLQSPNNSVKDTSLGIYNSMFVTLSEERGCDPDPGPKLEEYMKDAGFEEITVKQCPLPIGSWAQDKHLVRIYWFGLKRIR